MKKVISILGRRRCLTFPMAFPTAFPMALLAALLMVLISGCGGSGGSTTTNTSSTTNAGGTGTGTGGGGGTGTGGGGGTGTGGGGGTGTGGGGGTPTTSGMTVTGCPSSAVYEVTFTSQWNASSHGSNPPYPAGGNPHFTSLVGTTHNNQVTFWERGGFATPGVEGVAELGSTGTFQTTDVANAMTAGNAHMYISLGGLGAYPSERTGMIMTTEDYPLLTLISMIAPTPDWFVGVSGLKLREDNGCWESAISMPLIGNDAGTETGSTYRLSNPAESPHKPIGPITALPTSVRNTPFATLTLILQANP